MILTTALRLYCTKHKIRARRLARETGLLPATAQNFLNGELLNADNFAKILIWAMQPGPSDIKRSKGTEESGTDLAAR